MTDKMEMEMCKEEIKMQIEMNKEIERMNEELQ